jgi:hypothetical protein
MIFPCSKKGMSHENLHISGSSLATARDEPTQFFFVRDAAAWTQTFIRNCESSATSERQSTGPGGQPMGRLATQWLQWLQDGHLWKVRMVDDDDDGDDDDHHHHPS